MLMVEIDTGKQCQPLWKEQTKQSRGFQGMFAFNIILHYRHLVLLVVVIWSIILFIHNSTYNLSLNSPCDKQTLTYLTSCGICLKVRYSSTDRIFSWNRSSPPATCNMQRKINFAFHLHSADLPCAVFLKWHLPQALSRPWASLHPESCSPSMHFEAQLLQVSCPYSHNSKTFLPPCHARFLLLSLPPSPLQFPVAHIRKQMI